MMNNIMNNVTVNTLRTILKDQGLKASGTKQELIDRLSSNCDDVIIDDGVIILRRDLAGAPNDDQYNAATGEYIGTLTEDGWEDEGKGDWADDFAQAWTEEEDEPVPVVKAVYVVPQQQPQPAPQPATTAQSGSAPVESMKYVGMDGEVHLFHYRRMEREVYKNQIEKCKQQFSADAVMLFKDLSLNKWIIKTSHGLFYDLDKNVIGQVMSTRPQNTPVDEAAEKAAEEILEDIATSECPVKGHKDIDAECGSKIRKAVDEAKAAHKATREWEKANKAKAPNHVPEGKEEITAYNTNATIGAQNEAMDPILVAIDEGMYKAACGLVSGLKKLFKKKG